MQLNGFQQDSNSDAIYVLISRWLLWRGAGRRKAGKEAERPVNQETVVVQVRDDGSLGWRGAAQMEQEET